MMTRNEIREKTIQIIKENLPEFKNRDLQDQTKIILLKDLIAGPSFMSGAKSNPSSISIFQRRNGQRGRLLLTGSAPSKTL